MDNHYPPILSSYQTNMSRREGVILWISLIEDGSAVIIQKPLIFL